MDEQLPYDSNMELLLHSVQELSLARDMETVMQIVRKAARTFANSDGTTFILREDDLCFYADEDAIEPLWKGNKFPMQNCISGWVMANKQAAIIPDIYKDERIPIDLYRPTFVKSMVMTPIRTIDPVGAIGTYWANTTEPSPAQLHLLRALADITAVTIENVRVYSELEQRVLDRTRELEATNKDLRTFSYSVSHDLRTPLRNIRNYIDMLFKAQQAGDTERATFIKERIFAGAADMDQLITDLLVFFGLTKAELNKDNVPMQQLVAETWNMITKQEADRKIEVMMAPIPNATGDIALLKQVWVNLLSNAVKYSRNKPHTQIEIGYRELDDNIEYYVKDNGIGFEEKYKGKLFEPFNRLHTKTEFEGTGLGLAIVERVITKHQGKVRADAVPNEGATFYFSLPK